MPNPTIIDVASRSAPRMAKWMKGAVKRPGALTKKAEAAGESPMEFAQEHAHSSGLTGQQARFALIAQKKPIPEKKGGDKDATKDRRARMYGHSRSRANRGER